MYAAPSSVHLDTVTTFSSFIASFIFTFIFNYMFKNKKYMGSRLLTKRRLQIYIPTGVPPGYDLLSEAVSGKAYLKRLMTA